MPGNILQQVRKLLAHRHLAPQEQLLQYRSPGEVSAPKPEAQAKDGVRSGPGFLRLRFRLQFEERSEHRDRFAD